MGKSYSLNYRGIGSKLKGQTIQIELPNLQMNDITFSSFSGQVEAKY
jgi:hypothetical protein